MLLEKVEKKQTRLSAKVSALLKENSKLKAENKSLSSELGSNEKTLDKLSKSYSTLKTESTISGFKISLTGPWFTIFPWDINIR